MYTRKLLCTRLGLSLATVRRLLLLLSILPTRILTNDKNLPVFYYSLAAVNNLLKHIILAALYKKKKRKRCCICHLLLNLLLLIDSRCIDCYIAKYCKLLVFGSKPWKKILNINLIDKAIEYLTKIKLSTK